jgi:membrane protease YdiL (CAAX protease family)
MRAGAAALLAHGLAAWLVLWWPFAGRLRYRRVARRGVPKRWARSIRRKWLATALLLPIALLAEVPLAECGIRWPASWWSTGVLLTGVLAGGGVIALRVRLPRTQARLRRVMQPFVELVPQRDERGRFVWLAVTAGVTEELLYRAFGLSYLHWLWPDLSSDGVLLLTSAAFGLAHLYQGWKNVLLTAVLGFVFGGLTIETGSVLPAILVHTLLDLRLLLLTPLVDPSGGPVPSPPVTGKSRPAA